MEDYFHHFYSVVFSVYDCSPNVLGWIPRNIMDRGEYPKSYLRFFKRIIC